MDARRDKGLCYNCDEKYVRGHRCQRRQLFLLIREDEEEEPFKIEFVFQENEELIREENVHISMHALVGCNSFRTMRLAGKIKGRSLTILIDSGT